jgi:hypothetical protein
LHSREEYRYKHAMTNLLLLSHSRRFHLGGKAKILIICQRLVPASSIPPALLLYSLSKELFPQVVMWHGELHVDIKQTAAVGRIEHEARGNKTAPVSIMELLIKDKMEL